MKHQNFIQENLGSDLGFDLGLAAAPAPENGLDGTADFFVNVFKLSKEKKSCILITFPVTSFPREGGATTQ